VPPLSPVDATVPRLSCRWELRENEATAPTGGDHRKKTNMKLIKSLTVFACAFALLATVSVRADDAPKKASDLPACCAKAKKAGKECTHKCCQAAAKDGKTCEKCAKKSAKKKSDA
jgi:hypothetical protein